MVRNMSILVTNTSARASNGASASASASTSTSTVIRLPRTAVRTLFVRASTYWGFDFLSI